MAETRTENLISRAELYSLLHYDPHSGLFFWRRVDPNHTHLLDQQAGSIYSSGHRYIQIKGVDYRCGRLAWFYMTGEWVSDFIDHKDGDKANDRITNLRPATNSQNQANRGLMLTNTSGLKGVSYQRSRNKWIAVITVEGKAKNLGRYATKEEAAAAYDLAAIAAWGEFAVTNASLG